MGIPRGSARLLLAEAKRRPFSGRLMTLGRMQVFFSVAELRRWARRAGVAMTEVERPALSHDPMLARSGCMDDRTFFSLLGCDSIESCDISAYEGADHVLDLNLPLPDPLKGRYDIVFEGGTIQHIFHLPQVLSNISEMLVDGGRILHGMLPGHNYVDHGFYTFSPTLFHDYYQANGFRVETFYLCEFRSYWAGGRWRSTPWRVYRYTPGCLDHLSARHFSSRRMCLFVVATRLPESTVGRIPQQGTYRQVWSHLGHSALAPPDTAGDPGSLAAAIGARLEERERDPPRGGLRDLRLFWLVERWKRLRERLLALGPRRMPPRVGRF